MVKKVLVVDDDPCSQEILSFILEKEGYEVVTADNGFDALDLIALQHQEIDLIFTDIMMPGMCGIEMLRLLDTKGIVANMPIVVQSGAIEHDETKRRLGHLKTAHLPKPFTSESVASAMREALHCLTIPTIAPSAILESALAA